MITLGRNFFEQEEQSRYGKVVVPVINEYRRAEADSCKVASKVITPDQMRNSMAIIKCWCRKNPS